MNVFVKNLPDQMTDKQVNKYFRPHLERLGIQTYHCDKLKSKGCAVLTILDIPKAQHFLMIHGQDQPGPQGFKRVRQKLFHQNRPINCTLNRTPPDRFMIGSLEKQEMDRYAKPIIVRQHPSESPRRTFEIVQFWCGQWDYNRGELAFAGYYHSVQKGRITFGSQGIFVKLTGAALNRGSQPTQLLEISYRSINSVTTGSREDPSITLSLTEPPKMFEMLNHPEDILSSLTAGLTIGQKSVSNIKRMRISRLDFNHATVVSSCLCYRFQLRDTRDITEFRKLKQFAEIPGFISMDAPLIFRIPFASQMGSLMQQLSDSHKMPFELKFQLQKLAQNGSLAPSRVHQLLQAIGGDITDENRESFVDAVYQLYARVPFAGPNVEYNEFALETLVNFVREKTQRVDRGYSYADSMKAYEHVILVHKATVTPTRVYLDGPAPETKNRVLRKYAAFANHFLSVSFTDEDGDFLRQDRQTSTEEMYGGRFKELLENNIAIAGRLYQFLGFSHSSLRAHTCWYMAPFTWNGSLIYAQGVIKDLGDFSLIRSPAKCAARIGQAFSQTLSSVKIPESAIQTMPDVERNGRTFSDGVGTCSLEILQRIWDGSSSNQRPVKPTILQIRFQGAKGVISLDSRLEGSVLRLRPSMIKFEGTKVNDVEICGSAIRPLPMYLNRQVIKLLEDLGVEEKGFLELQDRAVEKLRSSTLSSKKAADFLERNRVGEAAQLPWLIRKLWTMGLQFRDDYLLRNSLETAVLVQLRELKHRARILVDQGVTLYGIMDETETLKEGQIYCTKHSDRGSEVITGDVIVTRSPALHPGDIQCVRAINVPQSCALAKLHNVVVFSSEGQRDLPSQLSGGDLDGDLYNIIYDSDLYPKRVSTPADYNIITPIDIKREVERKDITDHFRHFMQNDNLGIIATLHQILADQNSEATFSAGCLQLAGLHSNAVDFSKTGIPVKRNEILPYPKARPDFLAPGPQVLIDNKISFNDIETVPDADETNETDDLLEAESYKPQKNLYYPSQRILGKLYRAIDEAKFLKQVQDQAESSALQNQDVLGEVWNYIRRTTLLIQWEHHLEAAKDIKESYEDNLVDTMMNYSPHASHCVSEVEVFAGCILGRSGAQSKRQREYSVDMKDKHNRDVEYTVRCIREGEGDEDDDEVLPRSIASLRVSLSEGRSRPKVGILVSFGWVAAAVCLQEVEKFLN